MSVLFNLILMEVHVRYCNHIFSSLSFVLFSFSHFNHFLWNLWSKQNLSVVKILPGWSLTVWFLFPRWLLLHSKVPTWDPMENIFLNFSSLEPLNLLKAKVWWNVPWIVLCKLSDFCMYQSEIQDNHCHRTKF